MNPSPSAIAELLHPLQRGEDVRPQPIDELAVRRAFEVGRREHDEQRRRIGAAVIAAERDFMPRAAISPLRISCRILPGSASCASAWVVAWVAARNSSTPRAMSGDAHSVSSAVMIPSRPNGVLNHGMPAYG